MRFCIHAPAGIEDMKVASFLSPLGGLMALASAALPWYYMTSSSTDIWPPMSLSLIEFVQFMGALRALGRLVGGHTLVEELSWSALVAALVFIIAGGILGLIGSKFGKARIFGCTAVSLVGWLGSLGVWSEAGS